MPRRSAADAALTRAALVEAARQCFVTDGYHGTSTTTIARRAGCSQSALFHHFADKAALFEVIVAAAVSAYDDEVGRAALGAPGGPVEQVLAGCRRSLELASDPDWSRLVAVEAPAALGADRFHALDADLGLRSTRFAIRSLKGAGILTADTDVDALSLVLYGALTSSAFEIARRRMNDRMQPDDHPAEPDRTSHDPPSIDRVMAVVRRLILAHSG